MAIGKSVTQAGKSARRAKALLAEAQALRNTLTNSLSSDLSIPKLHEFEAAAEGERMKRSNLCSAQFDPWKNAINLASANSKGQLTGLGTVLKGALDQLVRLSSAMSGIIRAAARAEFSSSAARICIREAEANLDRSDPQLTQEAADLGDSAALQCDVDDFDRRITLLRAIKFAAIKTVPQFITDGQPGSTFRELGTARAALNTCDSAQLREALQNIGGKKKPQKLLDASLRIRQQLELYSLLSQAGKPDRDKRVDQALDILRQAKRLHRNQGHAS